MKEITLHTGEKTQVDDCDFEFLNKYKWHRKKNKHTIYACRLITINGKNKSIFMHREILGINDDKNKRGDHKDFNGLNNQRFNLRVATHAENNCYKQSAKSSTCKFLGVSFCKITGRWRATIYKNYKQTHLGRFDTQEAAAEAYNIKAKELHGEFANLNKI